MTRCAHLQAQKSGPNVDGFSQGLARNTRAAQAPARNLWQVKQRLHGTFAVRDITWHVQRWFHICLPFLLFLDASSLLTAFLVTRWRFSGTSLFSLRWFACGIIFWSQCSSYRGLSCLSHHIITDFLKIGREGYSISAPSSDKTHFLSQATNECAREKSLSLQRPREGAWSYDSWGCDAIWWVRLFCLL